MAVSVLAIVQARMSSTRFPGKVMKEVGSKPLIEILLNRLSKSQKIDKIILATSINKQDDILTKCVTQLGYGVYRGSEDDVLDRYYQAAKPFQPEIVVRITGDCPLIDPVLVDAVIDKFLETQADYASNIDPPTYPDGLDTEVFKFNLLETSFYKAKSSLDREHVTTYIRNKKDYKKVSLVHEKDLSSERWTVDEPEDYEVISQILKHFDPNIDFTWEQILELKVNHSSYFSPNNHLKRNEGSILGKGQKLWKRAKKVIPGGNMVLSKRAEMFLPEKWPAYFSRAKGCRVWDLDGNEYIDMSTMGIGTNILGYGHPEVDEAVGKVVEQGNMSTFNCPEEVYLAERLVELHPWASMVRFARTGGEANAIAIRIARAAAGKDKVAICGYHGWHDWYLAKY